MIPTSVQQYLFVSTKQTFSKPNTQPTVNHPITLTNLSQHNIIFRVRSNQAKHVALASGTFMIGPYQSHQYNVILKGQMPKEILIKLEVTWCQIVSNTNGTKLSTEQMVTQLGKVDVENTGRRVVSFKRVLGENEINQPTTTTNNNDNPSKQQQTTTTTTNQKQQNTQLKQTIKALQHQLSCNQTIIKELKEMNNKLGQMPNIMMQNMIKSGLVMTTIKQQSKSQNMINNVSNNDNNSNKQLIEKRITIVTEMILGLMKPGGLNQLLVKMEGLMWESKLSQYQQDVNVNRGDNSQQRQQQFIQQQINNKLQLPQYVRKLQQASYQLVMQLLKKTNQMKGNNI